jgi:putative ABC transport system permease protein
MDELILDSHSGPRFSMLLLTLFAGLGVVLAMVGIYGILTYAVIQQTHEMGLRMALGAQPRHVLQRVLRQGVVLTLTGIVIGLVGALWLTRFLTSLLHEISPTDPATFAVIAAGALVMALLASYLPARKATKVDPLVALRYE